MKSYVETPPLMQEQTNVSDAMHYFAKSNVFLFTMKMLQWPQGIQTDLYYIL